MKKLLVLFLLCFYFCTPSHAQDTCSLRISLLTCSPGEELYSTFGHTAIRVQDRESGLDEVYNYGTFEFSPEFYSQFIRGKLLYYLSVENFNDFVAQYQWESRSIVEQDLLFSCEKKQQLYEALQVNALEQNKYYRYDFLFDNCTTRAKDIIAKNADSAVVFNNILPDDRPSFRDLIHSYLNKGGQYWSKLGIDMLLGSDLDELANNEESMFLPDWLLNGYDHATVNGKPVVTKPATVLTMPSPLNKGSWFRPVVVFSILFVLFAALTFVSGKGIRKVMQMLDFLFFFLLGASGVLMLFMWFGTDHYVCRNNFNLLWALPTHLVMAFFVGSKKAWVRGYFRVVFWITLLFGLSWLILPQEINPAIIPILLIILLRSWFLSKNKIYAGEKA